VYACVCLCARPAARAAPSTWGGTFVGTSGAPAIPAPHSQPLSIAARRLVTAVTLPAAPRGGVLLTGFQLRHARWLAERSALAELAPPTGSAPATAMSSTPALTPFPPVLVQVVQRRHFHPTGLALPVLRSPVAPFGDPCAACALSAGAPARTGHVTSEPLVMTVYLPTGALASGASTSTSLAHVSTPLPPRVDTLAGPHPHYGTIPQLPGGAPWSSACGNAASRTAGTLRRPPRPVPGGASTATATLLSVTSATLPAATRSSTPLQTLPGDDSAEEGIDGTGGVEHDQAFWAVRGVALVLHEVGWVSQGRVVR